MFKTVREIIGNDNIAEQIATGFINLHDHDELFQNLFDHFSETGEMPYGVAKALDDDPVDWIRRRLLSSFMYDHRGSTNPFRRI